VRGQRFGYAGFIGAFSSLTLNVGAQGTLCAGVAYKCFGWANAIFDFSTPEDAYDTHYAGGLWFVPLDIQIQHVGNGRLQLQWNVLNGQLTQPIPNFVINQSIWYYIEFKCAIFSNGADWELHVNGKFIDSGVIRLPANQVWDHPYATHIGMPGPGGGTGAYVTDFYAGSDFVGDLTTVNLYPDRDIRIDGTWSKNPNDSQPYCQHVRAPVSAGSYIAPATPGDDGTFGFDNLPDDNVAIPFVVPGIWASGATGDVLTLKPAGSGTPLVMSFQSPPTPAFYNQWLYLNPATGLPWTVVDVNGLQITVEKQA
jgi:hypothetical protein